MTTDIAPVVQLLNVESGEVLPATVENAGTVLRAAREMKQKLNDVVGAATDYLLAESAHQGAKTFHIGRDTVTLTGGEQVEYDPTDLTEALREAGCPEDRINEVVVAEITYKVNRSVLRQLVAANPDYRAAAELAERRIEKPYRATVR